MTYTLDICTVYRQTISISYNLLVFVDYIIMISNETALGQGSLFFIVCSKKIIIRKHWVNIRISYLQRQKTKDYNET
jgi:hypothetical protein